VKFGKRHSAEVKRCRAAERQSVVDNYFEHEAGYWKSVYEATDLAATTLQQRTQRSLQWVREVELPPGAEILDAGCGAGQTSVTLARWGYRVHAVDHAPAMVELTRQTVEQAGLTNVVTPALADICCLRQFEDNRFGLVLALGVIGWLESPEQALREMRRVLKPGGHLILSVGNRWCLQNLLNPPYNPILDPVRRKLVPRLRRFGLLAPAAGEPRPLTHRRNSEIDGMLTAAGLEKVKGATMGFGPFAFFKKALFPNGTSVRLHHRLQAWADGNVPVLRSAGAVYVVLSCKPNVNSPQRTSIRAQVRATA
jgi:ubiquinone/menaquinone biosynthesis C-methylase UbiE